jgi:hypothetical protein
MQITQLFETTVVDRQSGREARFVVLPRRAFSDASFLPGLEISEQDSDPARFNHLVELLVQEEPRPVEIANLIFAVATCLSEGSWRQGVRLDESGRELQTFTADQIALAGVLAFSPVVPFEESLSS